ncbi:MAG: class I SAM-dependent methyltransferase [Chloroflexi bacterium]|nr:class I SAM-dependent methyltransferase [Chloroflexota bacterium]
MTGHSSNEPAKAYFQRVMDDWRPRQAVAHPYADNPTWQRNIAALRQWVADQGLEQKRVLEVGCGTGLLQDLVREYVGIDLASSSGQFMHKPFCAGSATNLPFPDGAFDGVWSIWVLEHINRPEDMLAEMRRVVKPGGSVFICAAYGVQSWVSQGLAKRRFRDLTWRQRITKATIPLRSSTPYRIATTLARRIVELALYWLTRRPTSLRYRPLQPNYETYWEYDADAAVSLDSFSVALYFLTRGDRAVYGGGLLSSLMLRAQPQAYIVGKR